MNKFWSRAPKLSNVVVVLQRNAVRAFTQNEKAPVKEKRENLFLKNVRLHFTHYFQSTTIHGVKYIGERGRYVLEKLVWTVIIFSVSVMCLVLIRLSYLRWRNSPVIVTFESGKTSISKIPFPAVTLCPETKFNKEILNYTDIFLRKLNGKNLTTEEQEHMQYASLICFTDTVFNASAWNNAFTPYIKKKLFDVRPTFTPLSTARVQWLGKTLSVNDALFPTFTSEGLCYTFNMLPNREVVRYEDEFMSSLDNSINSHNWSPEDGYLAGDNTDAYPRRAFMTGVESGLVIEGLLTNKSHLDYLCKGSSQGFRVILHHPGEFPDVGKHFRLPLDQAVLISIKPSLLTVSEELLHYSPNDRKCYFANEKYLATFKVYTQQNCLYECLSNYTYKKCKCTPFYFPLTSNDSKFCDHIQNRCIRESKLSYMQIESNTESGKQQCECLPLCTSLSYDVETSQTDWNVQEVHKYLTNYENRSLLKGVHTSNLYVYYQDRLFFSYNRKGVYGVADFFSNMGGLFGLFLGLSVTSVIEFVYFFTIRIVCNIRKYGRNAWSGEQESSNSA